MLACATLGMLTTTPAAQAGASVKAPAVAPSPGWEASTSFVAGFSADTPARVAAAAAAGVTMDILYAGPPSPGSALGRALSRAGMKVIDASLSSELFYWECHRTHTVAPPPKGQANYYCSSDQDPSINSEAVVLKTVRSWIRDDAANPLVAGYWILDDWASWDGGSGRALLQQVNAEIWAVTPRYPAICGFGGAVLGPGQQGGFDSATALNYSSSGCDMVGLYNYAYSGAKPSDGADLDWSMKETLKEELHDLAARGWQESSRPLLGIGQAWAGPYDEGSYTPGLSVTQIVAQAQAFCGAGAKAIAWYAWGDSGFMPSTLTPNNSAVIRSGIAQAIKTCGLAPAARQ
jgi:hypothetical protein